MTKKIMITVSVVMLIALVGSSQETVKVITTSKQPTIVVTTTTTTIIPTTKQKSTTQKATTTTKKSKPTTTKRVTTTKAETTTELKCAKSNHISHAGNMNKWFDSKAELKSYVDLTMRYWDEAESNGNIIYDEYTKKCPYGYEAWTCAGCGTWTVNFKYL